MPILGDYPWYGPGGGTDWPADTNTYWSSRYRFVPYVQAPNTAHIVWKRQGAIAGILGGTGGIYSLTGNPGNPSVIYAGRAYQTYTEPGVGSVAACYDLRTGEVYYEKPTAQGGVTPEFISYTKSSGAAVPGATEAGSYSVSLLSIGSRLIKIDPFSGAVTLNVTGMTPAQFNGAPGAYFGSFHNDPYVLSMQTLGTGAKAVYRLINWTTAGTETDFTKRIVSNITLPWGNRIFPNNSTRTPAIVCDFEAGIIANMFEVQPAGMGAYYGTTMIAANLQTGQLLWNITVEDTRYSSACLIADHGKVALLADNGYWVAWDLNSGQQVWKTELMDYPWSAPSFGAYSVQSAYGLLYREAYDGVYAFDWDTGKIVWKYKAPANSYETNYIDETGKNVYSFNAGGLIADGKFFTYNTEHSPTQPITRGWKLHCVNATTGEGIWNITGSLNPSAIADGYLAASGSYDGCTYVFGKGKSSTTVEGPKTAIQLGQSLVITGTVLDQSPGQLNTPCVSKDSMTTQMEYLHMQLPIDGIWHNLTMTGVPVALTAIDQNGNPTNIGTATTNAYYGTFEMAWTPPNEGTYKIIASFAGDDSYGSSGASTAVLVGAAEQQIVIPEQIVPPDYTMTLIGGFIAVIIAVAIVGILVVKRK